MCHSNIERGTFQIAQMVMNYTKYPFYKPIIINRLVSKLTPCQAHINKFPETIPIIKYTLPIYRLEPII